MPQDASTGAGIPEAELPVGPGSTSELLDATHVFAIEIRAVKAGPWAPGKDGLAHRRVEMTLALVEGLKGRLPISAGATFPLEVEQLQGANPFGDRPGLYSHLELVPGALHESTLDNGLYFLLGLDERPFARASELIPDADERARFRSAVDAFDSDRAAAVRAYLDHP